MGEVAEGEDDGGGDEGEGVDSGFEVFAGREEGGRWWEGDVLEGAGVVPGEAVEADGLVEVGVGGGGVGEEDVIVSLGLEGVCVAGLENWRYRVSRG